MLPCRCVVISCANRTACSWTPFANITVAIVDDCPGCGPNALALNSMATRELLGRRLAENEKFLVNWTFADCNPFETVR